MMMHGWSWTQIRFAAVIVAAFALLSPHAKAEERTVNFYNWSNYMAPGVLEDFTRETGIKVVYDTFDANETLETRLLAGKSGYDVVVPTGYFLQRQITAKVFLKLDKSRLPDLANAWPVVTKQLATYDPGNNYGANYMWGTTRIGYTIPKEGAQMFFDNLAIPSNAKNVAEAYELINYLSRPDVAAKNSDFLSYANGNLASQKLVDPKILNDKNIYPDDAMQKKLFVITARDPATQRIINRLWTRVKTGK